MFWFHRLLKFDKVKHLLEKKLPFSTVIIRFEQHAEVVRHVFVDLSDSSIKHKITVSEKNTLIGLLGQRHLHVTINLGVEI